MYEREKTEAARPPGKERGSARAPQRASRPQPRGQLGLPVAAGNAAAVEALRRDGRPGAEDQRSHGPGRDRRHTGQATPVVQRSAVQAVLRRPEQPLDEATRTARSGHVQRMNAGGSQTPTYSVTARTARPSAAAQPIEETRNERHLDVVISHLEAMLAGESGEPTCTVDLGGMTTGDALDLAMERRNTLQQKPTGTFNARQRAVPVTKHSGIVFTASEDIRRMADGHGLLTARRDGLAGLNSPDDTTGVGLHDKLRDGTWIPIIDDDNLLYIGPPKMRGPRANAAAPTGKPLISVPSSFSHPDISISGNRLTSSTTMTGRCVKGSRNPGQAAVMGGHSALNYATSVGLTDAGTMTWEWLHLVGSALGGMNVLGNLVAGTYDSNTQMTMLENRIAKHCEERVTPAQPATYTVSATLHTVNNAPTWVATHIAARFVHGSETMHGEFDAASPAAVDQLAYSYYDMLFGVQGGAVTQYSENLFSQG